MPSRIKRSDNEIELGAEYICLQLHPKGLRSAFLGDLHSAYKADLIVYVLQQLSWGMRDLFIALFATYLASSGEECKSKRIQKLIKEQEMKLAKLSKLITTESKTYVKKHASQRLDLHLKVLEEVRNYDPSIEKLLEETAHLLEEQGKEGLVKNIK